MSALENGDHWELTQYVNDALAENTLVLVEKTGNETITYEYGLDRIAAYGKEGMTETRTQYVYDGMGNVAQTVQAGNAWYNKLLPLTKNTQVKNIRYISLVEDTYRNPYTTRKSTNLAKGNNATAYYNKDGSYIVVDDITNEVIQVSNRFDTNWKPDPNIVDPYSPK